MGNVLALDLLFDGIKAVFDDDFDPLPSPVNIVFGWREVTKQINQGDGGAMRIVIVPGAPGGKFGTHQPPRNPGRDPRPLYARKENFTAYIWAVDATTPATLRDERAQWRAARMLYDAFDRAVYLTTHTDGDVGVGPVEWIEETWNLQKIERGFGVEIIAAGAVSSMVPDSKYELLLVDSTTTVTVGDQVQIVTTTQP